MLTCELNQTDIGIGVMPFSNIAFYSPTKFAKSSLYYVNMIGDYRCNHEYVVKRLSPNDLLDGFHFFIITSGHLNFFYQNRTFAAPSGSIVCIDCKQPHKYSSDDDVSFKWIFFNGSSSQNYCDLLHTQRDPVFFPNDFSEINSNALQMMRSFEKMTINEHRMSCTIHGIFSSLASTLQENQTTTEQVILDISKYINDHFTEKIVVQKLADQCRISLYHFIRLFTRLHNCTPYEYILNTRITHSKRLLMTTSMTITDISQVSGFSTPSNFIRAFRASTGLTPKQYRNYQ